MLGEPFQVMGLRFAPLNLPFRRRAQTFAALFWISLFLFFIPFSLWVFIQVALSPSYSWLTIIYLTWMIYDIKTPFQGGRKFPGFVRNWRIWKYYVEYFPVTLVKTKDLDPNKAYLIGSHPHGLLSCGAMATFCSNDDIFSKLFPGIRCRLITTSTVFFVPFIRELCLALGAISCLKHSIEAALRSGKGTAHVLVVGGALESMNLNSNHDEVSLVLNQRKGFIKLAIRFGADLVPSFSFGESKVYNQIQHPILKKIQIYFVKVFGFAPIVFMGRGIFQYSFGLLPKRIPINVIIGNPITVPQDPNPSDELISEIHAKYISELKSLFDEYKPIYGNADSKLIIQ